MTTAMFLVLAVEDDPSLRTILRTLLEANDYRYAEADSAARAHIEVRSHRPDLVLVDLGLPDRDGVEVIREIRKSSGVPILVLSARTLEAEKIQALDAGADDYVTKPFSAAELLARVRAALRRAAHGAERLPQLVFDAIQVDLGARAARSPAGEVHLTPLEYRILGCLALNAGLVVTQRRLIDRAWGQERIGDARSLRFHISRLRQKLEPDPSRPRFILTEAGVGYRLQADAFSATAPPAANPG